MGHYRPNIVLVMTDQQRADFSKADGFALDTQPFLDSLGAGGVRFRRAYTPMPICGPARCSLLTGRFPKATRVRENWGIPHQFSPTDLVQVLRGLGYSINISGKNHGHLGADAFDRAAMYGHRGGRPETKNNAEKAMDAWLQDVAQNRTSFSPDPTPFPLECQLPWRIVRDAIGIVEDCGDGPFFLWLSFPEPHNPYQAPEPYFSLFPEEDVPDRVAGPEVVEARGGKWRWQRRMMEARHGSYDDHWRRYRANYCGMLRLIDDQVRRFCEHLQTRGLMENTLLLFTSDHGDYAGDYGLRRKGLGLPECLVRVPLLWHGHGIAAQEAQRDDFVSLVDVMPTLCEALGVEAPYGVQGRSLWPLLTGGDYPAGEFRSIYAELGFGGMHYTDSDAPTLHFPEDTRYFDELNCVSQSGNTKMVRMGRWKLVFDMMGRAELYDVESDPGELTNLAGDPALRDVRLRMTEELLTWTIRTEDDLPGGKYVPKRTPRNWYWPFREQD